MIFKHPGFVTFVCALVFLFGYHKITTITFEDNKPRISALYCKFFAPEKSITTPTIIIPGTRGSLLASDTKQEWLSLGQILPGTEPFLYDPENNNLKATGVLARITAIPLLVQYSPYQRILAKLACQPHTYVFAYDWRLNPLDHHAALDALVYKISKSTGQKPSIVAHSMGGTLAHTYIKKHASKIERVVYVGVPFGSAVGFFDVIDQGTSVGLNYALLSEKALFSHPGSFTLLPHPGKKLYKNLDLTVDNVWKDHHLSVFRNPQNDYIEASKTLETNLSRAREYYKIIDAPKKITNEFLFVVGSCRDTLYSIEEDGTKVMRAGDGSVVADEAYPVEKNTLNYTVFNSCAKHDLQLNNRAIVNRIIDFLAE